MSPAKRRRVGNRGLRGVLRALRPEYGREVLRERLARAEERWQLDAARGGRDVCWTDDGVERPLVTIRISTMPGRDPVLVRRAIASALDQTHEPVEVLVVGDHAGPGAEAIARSFADPRLRFVDLPEPSVYPGRSDLRWYSQGAEPANLALALARGAWITVCDDDDVLTADHVEVLLAAARSGRYEMVHSRAEMEIAPDRWEVIGSPRLRRGAVAHGAVLYSSGLRFLRYSTTSWRRREPLDWNLWRRMRAVGVRAGFVDAVTYRHFLETPERTARAAAAEVRSPSRGAGASGERVLGSQS